MAGAAAVLLIGCGRLNFEAVERDAGSRIDAPSGIRDASASIDAREIDAPGVDASLDAGAPRDGAGEIDAPAVDGGPIAEPILARVITIGSSGIQVPTGIAVDAAGNVTVVGYTDSGLDFGTPLAGAGSNDGFVASFTPDGGYRWSRLIGSALDDQTWHVAADSANNVFVVGRFGGTVDFGGGPVTATGQRDAYVASYTEDGAYRWARVWGSNDDDTAFGLAVGGGNVFLSGWFYETIDLGTGPLTAVDGQDVFAASFTNTGTARFSSSFGAAGVDQGQKIAVDGSGRPVVGGLFSGSIDLGSGVVTSAGMRDGFVVAMDAAGTPRWSRTFGGIGGDEVTGIGTDPAGNVYVTGVFSATVDFGTGAVTSAGGEDGYVASYAAEGTPRWVSPLSGAGLQLLHRVTWSPRGYAVACGWFDDSFDSGTGTISSRGNQDGMLVAHDGSGLRLWTVQIGSGASESMRDVVVHSDHVIYAAGVYSGTADYGFGPTTSDGPDMFIAVLRQD